MSSLTIDDRVTSKEPFVGFSKQLTLDGVRIEGRLIKDLDEAIVSGDASRVLVARSVLYQHLKAKHTMGCRIKANLRTVD